MQRGILAGALLLALGACASNQAMYEWGNYQHDLLSYSKNPTEGKKFSAALALNIEKAEKSHRVPPGMFAEYGYMLLDADDSKGAVIYFAKERDRWPESGMLMNKVIGRLGKADEAHKGAGGQ
jgi:hypothetical protein